MRKSLLLLGFCALSFCAMGQAPEPGAGRDAAPREGANARMHRARPTTYEQVDMLRNELGLTHDQFDKVYKAYKKYNDAVFGEERVRPNGGQGRPSGPGGPGGPGGMGGRRGGGPGHPGGFGRGEGGPQHREAKKVDIKKLEKEKAKQEEKLTKSMKKVFKKDAGLFERWQHYRSEELRRLFPPMEKRH